MAPLPKKPQSSSREHPSSGHSPQLKYERVCCNLCGNDDTTVLYQVEPAKAKLSSVWLDGIEHTMYGTELIVRCRNCGLTYVNPRLADAPTLEPYSPETEMRYFVATQSARERAYAILMQQLPGWFGRKPASLLDIGCGDGVLVATARQAGVDAVGLEVSEPLRHLVRRRLGEDAVVAAPLSELEVLYDVITLINVVEHLRDPRQVVSQAVRCLKPGGLLLVHTPNLGGIPARLSGKRWHHLEPYAHFYYFTYGTLSRLLHEADLQVIDRFNLITAQGMRAQLQQWMGRAGVYIDNGLGLVARC